MKTNSLLICLAAALFLNSSCAHLPGAPEPTDAEINGEAAKAYVEIKSKSKVSTNKEWAAMVDRVSRRIASASGENFQWEWVLLDNPEPNAWCMPGGKMAVYSGIMPILKTEGALAAVMGHEVAHATRRHGKKGYARAISSKYLGIIVGGAAIVGGQVFCKTEKCKLLSALGGVAAGFAVAFFDRKFSRDDETEADKFGQQYMAKAGYDPAEAIRVWERMGAANKGKAPPEWMSTHPADEHRKSNLQGWLPETEGIYAGAPKKYGIGEAIK